MHDNLIVKSDHFATWKKFCESRKDLSCNKWKMSQEKYLLQNDNFNCGVFVCYFFSFRRECGKVEEDTFKENSNI